jgi:uncharacterized membrane protein
MILSEPGESRVRGYLYVLERSLRTFLPREVVADAVREVESHIRDRVTAAEPMPNERDALERILAELGPPLQVARAYADELVVEEAVATGRLAAVARAVLRVAMTGVSAFFLSILLFIGYTVGVGFAVIALLKPIFPDNVGLWVRNGVPYSFGAVFPPPEDSVLVGGYLVIPVALLASAAVLLVTHRAARAWLQRWRGRFRVVDSGTP